jgi:cyclophilin family peptidyl-prolyl cis-trans isomerase
LSALIVSALIYSQKLPQRNPTVGASATTIPSPTLDLSSPLPNSSVGVNLASPSPETSPLISPSTSPEPGGAIMTNPNPDLTVDSNGLSKATVIVQTSEGVIKFKFYSNDAPKTVKRLIELINKGFYNGLIFHRVVEGFVIQGGDPLGNGTGGSGQKLEAEFNARRHIEGTVAMARAADPNSADSQFYISLGTHPHLDNKYTVFAQVIEGMDVAKKIKIGDKMLSVSIQ